MINNSEFLKPLDKAHELECLKRTNENDEEARNLLIEHNLRLVLHIVKKFKNKVYNLEDLFSIGTIGLIKGIDTYDLNKGFKVSTYYSICIKNEILMYFKKDKKYLKNVSFDNTIMTEDGDMYTLEYKFVDDRLNIELDYEKKEALLELKNKIQTLNEAEQEIIKLYFGFYDDKKYTQQEIAEKFCTSQTQVSRKISKIIKKMRNSMK